MDALQGAQFLQAQPVDVPLPEQVLIGRGEGIQALAKGGGEGGP